MAYRETSVEGPCHLCEELTSTRCPTCGQPTCAAHVRDDMCRTCREALAAHLAQGRAGPWLDIAVVVAGAGLATSGVVFFPLLFVGIGIIMIGPGQVTKFNRRRREAQLRKQLRERGRLPELPNAAQEAERIALTEYEAKRRDQLDGG